MKHTDERDPREKVVAFPEFALETHRRKNRLRIMGGACAVVLVLILVFLAAQFTPWLAIKTIQVQGVQQTPVADIQNKLAPLKGTTLSRVDRQRVKNLLGQTPSVEDVRIAANPPSTLVVNVIERRPVAAVKYNDSSYGLIDKDGVQLKTVDNPDDAALPVIDGGASAIKSDVFSSIANVLQSLPPDILSQLTSASAKTPSSVTLKLKSGVTVQWGAAEDNTLKARVLTLLLAQPPQDPPVKEIDVSAPRSPVTR